MSGGVKKLAQVVVGAVIGFVQGGPWGAAVGAGLAFYAAEQQEKLNTKSPLRDNEPSAQTVRSSKAPARFILGRVSTGGVLVWAQEQAGTQTDGEWLHLVYVLCEGAVDGLENIYLGEEEIATYGAYASYELVISPTAVNAFLKANCPDWKDEQIGRGLSFVRLSLRYNAEKFPAGIPDARFIVRGRNDIYDPRTGMSIYSENTALQILWFLRNRCGVPDDEIVFETFASGANVCDESVVNPDGSTSARYRSSCVIGADEQRTNVLQKLETAYGGKVIRVGGRWMFQAGAYYGPHDFEITEDMVVGTITGSTEPTNDAAINTVRGTFIDPSQSWTETDYPEVSIADWVVADGGEAAETLTFSYVSNAYQAQRLANIELRRRRAGGTINVPMNFLGYNCRPGRAVRVNLPSLNIMGEFIVTNWSMGSNEGCTASLQHYDAAQFDDAVGQPYNPIGFINLPAGGLGSPTNLSWATDEAAEVTQGVLSWAQPTGIVTGYAITVRQAGVAVQAQQVPETTSQLPIAGLPSGSYTMSVAALGPLTRSGEASITVSINGPSIPESCAVQSTIDTITLVPSNLQHGLNGGTYEYFFSTNPEATQGDYLGRGLSFTHAGLAFATNYAYFIRSKNAYGASAFLKVVASTSNDVTALLAALAEQIGKGQLAQELLEEIEKISGDGPGSVNDRLEEAKQELYDRIDELTDALAYDGTKAYALGDVVRVGQRLYQARAAVPAGVAPPDPQYWADVGTIVETVDALAMQVQQHQTAIEELDGKVTASASQLQALQAAWRADDGEGDLADAMKGWDSTARFAEEVRVRASQNEAVVTRLTSLDAGVAGNKAGITLLEQVVATNEQAAASRISQLKTEVDGNTTHIQQVSESLSDTNQAVASLRTSVESVYTAGRDDSGEGELNGALDAWQTKAKFSTEVRTLANADVALARKSETLEASIGDTRASVQQISETVVGVDGKVSAISSWKTETNLAGKRVATGIIQGSDGEVGEILLSAQRVAIIDGINGVEGNLFVFQGGQLFLNQALINTAFIQQIVAGMTIVSAAKNAQGLPLLEINFAAGTFVLRGQDADGSTLLNNGGLYVYDINGVERTAVGRMTQYVYSLSYLSGGA